MLGIAKIEENDERKTFEMIWTCSKQGISKPIRKTES